MPVKSNSNCRWNLAGYLSTSSIESRSIRLNFSICVPTFVLRSMVRLNCTLQIRIEVISLLCSILEPRPARTWLITA